LKRKEMQKKQQKKLRKRNNLWVKSMSEEYTDEEIEEIKKNATKDQKLDRLLDDMAGIKDRLDNGLAEEIARNSLNRKITVILWTGLILLLLGKGFF